MKIDLSALLNFAKPNGLAGILQSNSGAKESFATLFKTSLNISQTRNPEENYNEDETSVTEIVKPKREEKPELPAKHERRVEKKINDGAETVHSKYGVQTTETRAEKTESEPVLIKLKDVLEDLDLTDEQLTMLAELLGVRVDQLSEIELAISEISIETGSGQITDKLLQVKMPDGTLKDLAALFDLKKNDTNMDTLFKETINKIAEILNLDESQTEKLFTAIKVSVIEVKAEEIDTKRSAQAQQALLNAEGDSDVDVAAVQKSAKDSNGAETGDDLNAETELEKGDPGATKEKPMVADADFETFMSETEESSPAPRRAAAQPGMAAEPATQTVKQESPGLNMQQAQTEQTPVVNVKSNAAQTAPASEPVKIDKPEAQRVMNQIVEKARIISFPNKTQVRISLNPPSLGSMDIKIVVQNAQVKGSIVVETLAVKQIVEQNLDQLKAALNEQGVAVEEIEVSVSNQDLSSFDSQMAERGKAASGDASGSPESNGATTETAPSEDPEAIRKAMQNLTVDIKV